MSVRQLEDSLAMDAFGRTKTEAIEKGICVSCGTPPGLFRDKLGLREFEITQMCQVCQDNVLAEAAALAGESP